MTKTTSNYFLCKQPILMLDGFGATAHKLQQLFAKETLSPSENWGMFINNFTEKTRQQQCCNCGDY